MTKRRTPTEKPVAEPTTPALEPQSQPQPQPQTQPPKTPTRPGGKLGSLIDLLRRPEGARLDEMMDATGWQAHSVRGAMAGALKKKHGLAIVSERTEAGRVYRIDAEPRA